MSILLLALVTLASFSAGLLVGIKHAQKGQAIKDAIKK